MGSRGGHRRSVRDSVQVQAPRTVRQSGRCFAVLSTRPTQQWPGQSSPVFHQWMRMWKRLVQRRGCPSPRSEKPSGGSEWEAQLCPRPGAIWLRPTVAARSRSPPRGREPSQESSVGGGLISLADFQLTGFSKSSATWVRDECIATSRMDERKPVPASFILVLLNQPEEPALVGAVGNRVALPGSIVGDAA